MVHEIAEIKLSPPPNFSIFHVANRHHKITPQKVSQSDPAVQYHFSVSQHPQVSKIVTQGCHTKVGFLGVGPQTNTSRLECTSAGVITTSTRVLECTKEKLGGTVFLTFSQQTRCSLPTHLFARDLSDCTSREILEPPFHKLTISIFNKNTATQSKTATHTSSVLSEETTVSLLLKYYSRLRSKPPVRNIPPWYNWSA